MEHRSDGGTNCHWCSWDSHEWIDTETGRSRNKKTSGDHPNYNIIKIGQNTEESPDYSKKPSVNAGVKNWKKFQVTSCQNLTRENLDTRKPGHEKT